MAERASGFKNADDQSRSESDTDIAWFVGRGFTGIKGPLASITVAQTEKPKRYSLAER